MKRRGEGLLKLERNFEVLVREETLPDAMRDHSFGGTYRGHRECHIEFDWLIIYRVDENRFVLVATRTGNPSFLGLCPSQMTCLCVCHEMGRGFLQLPTERQ